ncbi:MAG: VCBS repeat-containing protein [Bdellovibrionota bacterium]
MRHSISQSKAGVKALFQLALLALASLAMTGSTSAQTLELTAPAAPVSAAEGDDFASSVLENPWDMNERRDIGYEENFDGRSIQSSGGVWSGVNAGPGGYIFPLFGGFSGSLLSEGLMGDRELPRFGANHPVDSSRYTLLSYRLRHSARSTLAVYWTNKSQPTLFPDGSQFGTSFDGLFLDRAYPHQGFFTYTFNLRAPAFDSSGGGWNGAIRALRLDPSTAGPAGSTTELDWVRLVDPSSAPTLPISWRGSGLPDGTLITVWYDADSSGYDGTPLAQYSQDSRGRFYAPGELYSTTSAPRSANGSHQLVTASLPPGTYRFYVTAETARGGARTTIARSGYSAPLTINARPSLVFESPTQSSGHDYATDIHNPWEMSDRGDVANLPESGLPQMSRQFSNATFTNGIFQAIADLPLTAIGNAQSDPQVWLNVSSVAPIDPRKYRYLTYRIGADETHFPTIHDKVAGGWVTRPVFWGSDLFAEGASTLGHILYEGMHTYTIDLWNDAGLERGMPWRNIRAVRNLRIDPTETSIPTWFFIDGVTLTAENHPEGSSFQIRFRIQDGDSSSFTASLYASPTSDSLGSPIVTLNGLAGGEHAYDWNTAGLPNGSYYITAAVSDGISTSVFKAPTPVVVGSQVNPVALRRVPYDYNGDGVSDPVVYRPARKRSSFLARIAGVSFTKVLGNAASNPLSGDFDGDGRADFATVQLAGNAYVWSTTSSLTGQTSARIWGMPGDVVAPADYDGDGATDLAVYRAGGWHLLMNNGSTFSQPWGEPTDVPVPTDYDGDGRADIAIWRPRDGTWWVINSGFGWGQTPTFHQVVQWGLPGDVPIPGDFDNDGKADFVVFRPSTGTWFLRLSGSDLQQSFQWGLPGDTPVLGDFDGDGRLDLCVYRPATGAWYINNRSGIMSAAQWGLPSDRPPTTVAP